MAKNIKIDKVNIFTYSHSSNYDFISPSRVESPDFCYVDSSDDIVDSSGFMPDINEVRLFSASGRGSNLVGQYDFEDGIDNGINLTPLRSKSLDVTEIDAIQSRVKADFENSMNGLGDMVKEEIVSQSATQSATQSVTQSATQS